jgi:hypothetical protein
MKNYMGKDGFIWFQGVVEDRDDPLKLGRCRVRCLGFHTDDKTKIQTKDLPWAYPIQPITCASINGIGQTPLGPVEGTWVVGFFRDGGNMQQPVFFGTLGGIPQTPPDTTKGFNDPSGTYPKEEFIKEQDTNRLARGITMGTVVEKKILDAGTGGRPTANEKNDHGWVEPHTQFNSQYPYNHVYESESGHIQEFDDTPNAERIHTYHKKGTFEEIYPDGSKVTKVVDDDYELVYGKKFVHISGNANVLVGDDTADGNLTLYVKGNVDMQVDGNVTETVNGGDVIQTVKGGGVFIKTDAPSDEQGNAGAVHVDASGSVSLFSKGAMNLSSKKSIRLKAPTIHLN